MVPGFTSIHILHSQDRDSISSKKRSTGGTSGSRVPITVSIAYPPTVPTSTKTPGRCCVTKSNQAAGSRKQNYPHPTPASVTTTWLRIGKLLDIPGRTSEKRLSSPQDCGTSCGEFFTQKPDGEMPSDQRRDDSGSLVFDSGKLHQPVEILGRPRIRLKVSIDKPLGNIAVRLNDIHPNGEVSRVSWGVLNLAHRNGNENPEPMTPGQLESIEIELNECGYRFMRGHQMRIAVSSNYWPMVMPPTRNRYRHH